MGVSNRGLRISDFALRIGNSDTGSILRTWLYTVDPVPFQWR
jgi:hypothetical protein